MTWSTRHHVYLALDEGPGCIVAPRLGMRVANAVRKEYTRQLSGMCLTGVWRIVIGPERYTLAFEEFTLREFKRDRETTGVTRFPTAKTTVSIS